MSERFTDLASAITQCRATPNNNLTSRKKDIRESTIRRMAANNHSVESILFWVFGLPREAPAEVPGRVYSTKQEYHEKKARLSKYVEDVLNGQK